MADEEIELAWRLSVEGAEEVKAKISDLHDQFNRGEISTEQYAKGLRSAGSELKTFSDASQLQTRAFMAAHPGLGALSRAMSGFSSILRAGQAASNAMNLAMIATQGTSSNLAALQAEAAAAQRAYNKAVAEFGPESEEASMALDQLNAATAKVREEQDKMAQQSIQNAFTFATSMGIMVSSAVQSIPRIKTELGNLSKSIGETFGKLGGGGNVARALGGMAAIGLGATALATGGFNALIGQSDTVADKLKAIGGIGAIGVGIALEFPAIAKIALIGTAIATATVAIILFRKELADTMAGVAEALAPAGGALMKFFTEDLPAWGTSALSWLSGVFSVAFTSIWQGILAVATTIWDSLKSAFVGFWNGMIGVANAALAGIASGIQGFINSVIDGINALISIYNAAARALGQGTMATVSRISIPVPQIPVISAATGFNGILAQDTIFQAHRGEMVRITPASDVRGGLGGGTTVIHNHHHNYHIEGSVWSERDLKRMIGRGLYYDLRDRGV
ncbi:hypothetical protein Ngar_c13540 [Candidatus Nitrososphaera gargensis Ga9.2]|uniref:Uncharacterized protein n=1 Tax=Nitrososphaera gargensis (strain Ga9.2) TaxID=1237085 RepID=K0IJ82_NITGG|nr:hypothetical protein [Candidatus Nitrososphaera gargensis]AFU58292.1 hypothetical protein Ngar_c13540 [Candidatus Nitrososphaera gargensis Ga9.2]